MARALSMRELRALAADERGDPEVRARAIRALGMLAARGTKSLLLSILAGGVTDDVVLWELGKALVKVGVKGAAVPPLIAILAEGTVEQRKMAAWALGMGVASGRVRRALESVVAATAEHPDVRAHAAEGLGNLGRKSSVDVLLATLSDPEPAVRFWSAYALGEIGDRRAVKGLRHLLTDESEVRGLGSVAAEARSAMERIGERQGTRGWRGDESARGEES